MSHYCVDYNYTFKRKFSGKLRSQIHLSGCRLTKTTSSSFFFVARPYLLTPAGLGSLFLSGWACHHPAPASLTPYNDPSSTPVSSLKTPPSFHLPPESFPLHLDPKREHGGMHKEECVIQVSLQGYQECSSCYTHAKSRVFMLQTNWILCCCQTMTKGWRLQTCFEWQNRKAERKPCIIESNETWWSQMGIMVHTYDVARTEVVEWRMNKESLREKFKTCLSDIRQGFSDAVRWSDQHFVLLHTEAFRLNPLCSTKLIQKMYIKQNRG